MSNGIERPEWDDYYGAMVLVVAMRSPDPSTKCGAVIVDEENRVVSLGYNGAPRGFDDSDIPWDIRPDKYFWVIHSEENALFNAHQDVTGCTMYITGRPCYRCLGRILHSGIKRIVYGKGWTVRGNAEITGNQPDDEKLIQEMLRHRPDVSFEMNEADPRELLSKAISYFSKKLLNPESQNRGSIQ